MHVDVSKLDPERFDISQRHVSNIGPVFLINPAKAMFSLKLDELHLRSLVVREGSGEVISAGFPKFYNYGEDPLSDEIARKGLAERRTVWRKKLDGTLIIRSVVEGHVYLRTRGSHELGAFDEPVRKLFFDKHHEWLDARYLPMGSHLFEYCAPDNRVVLRYPEAKLWALAWIFYDGANSPVDGLTVREPFPPQSMDQAPYWISGWEPTEILSELKKLTHEEGYVAWTQMGDGTFHLSKWKTDWYKHLHSLRSQASPRFIKEYCVRHQVHTLDEFKAQLAKDDFDWEFASYLEPSFEEFRLRWDEIRTLVDAFELQCFMQIGYKALNHPKTPVGRKELALDLKRISTHLGQEWLFHYGIMSYTGKEASAQELLNAKVLDIGVVEFRHLQKKWAEETAARSAP